MKKALFVSGFLFVLNFTSYGLNARTVNGNSWTGDVAVKNEIMRVKVHPSYLDIEAEISLKAHTPNAQVPDPSLPLEIHGNFILPENSVISGALLWNGNTILQAKLKSKETATMEYEDVVDRQPAPPPRPRDPMIIEKLSGDTYNLMIYPFSRGQYRKIRIRYIVPRIFPTVQSKTR
ncbi:MAG: VIT domain-containing protein [Fibrobacterota bacterium]